LQPEFIDFTFCNNCLKDKVYFTVGAKAKALWFCDQRAFALAPTVK